MNVLKGKESRRRTVSESGLLYDLLGYDTTDSQDDLDRLADHRRNNVLGFFSPTSHAESQVNGRTPALRPHLHFGRNREFVLRSVNAANSVNLPQPLLPRCQAER